MSACALPQARTKVCRAHDGNIESAELAGGESAKQAALQHSVKRQRFWLGRRTADSSHIAWRPAKRFRTSAKWWLLNLDSQISVSLPFNGLQEFQRNAADPCWAASSWHRWPHITVCIDQGSDGLSAVSYLRNSLEVNCSVIPDWSHGGHNDLYDSLKDQGLFSFWVMCLVCFNLEHGPWADDLRWAQVADSWAEATREFSPTNMLIFAEHLAVEVHAQGGASVVMQSAEADETLEQRMWRLMHSGWRPKGYRTCLNRFFASRENAASFGAWWHLSLMKYTYLCLESG